MGLAASGSAHHPVTTRGIAFLRQSQRSDGSWPIDTNLATWVSTRAVQALEPADDGAETTSKKIPRSQAVALKSWLLAQQIDRRHPFTGASPGGWAWTDAPGGVPDADDTAGALVALRRLGAVDATTRTAATAGVRWLLDLQNRDGGVPTFCRGWGRLPFDRSCADLTAHALRAWSDWRDELEDDLIRRIDRAIRRGLRFLAANQADDGSWTPLWFGSQEREDRTNPVYGTALVLDALSHPRLSPYPGVDSMCRRARGWLVATQNDDGGWGNGTTGASTVEETALALAGLAPDADTDVVIRGAAWLVECIETGCLQPSPIGLYFANLWYSEALYPLVFSTRALRRALRRLGVPTAETQQSLQGAA